MLYAIVAVIALILDQAVKYWTTVNIVADVGTRELIPGFLRLTNVHNTGAAFGFLEGARWFFVILCLVFVALVIYALVKGLIRTPVARWMAVAVVAGAVGNCIDRVVCGYVVDMFEFEFMRFPVFNVADILITVGAVLFAVCVLFEKDGKADAKEAEAQTASSGKAVPAKKSPSARKRRGLKKTPIPSFPAHAPVRQPQVDPNDPFAEWERRADAHASPAPEQAPPAETAPVREAAPAPKAPPSVKPVQPRPAAKPAESPKAPAAPAPKAALAQPSSKAGEDAGTIESAADELSFDLDEILAEFKDL